MAYIDVLNAEKTNLEGTIEQSEGGQILNPQTIEYYANVLKALNADPGSASSGIGLPTDPVATSNTGNHSLISLFKRYLSLQQRQLLTATATVSTAGDTTLVAAPGSGRSLLIRLVRIQNQTDQETTLLWKQGATTFAILLSTAKGSGLSEPYDWSLNLELPENTALTVNQSVAQGHGYTIFYHNIDSATKL